MEPGQRYAWRAESSWAGCAAPGACVDRVPQRNEVTASVADPPAPDQLAVPPTRVDARDMAVPAVDLAAVTFGQRGADMVLQLIATRAWRTPAPGRPAPCIRIFGGALDAPRGRICVSAGGATAGADLRATRRLRRAPAGGDGAAPLPAIAAGDVQSAGGGPRPGLALLAGRVDRGLRRGRSRARRGRRAHADRTAASALLRCRRTRAATPLRQPAPAACGRPEPDRCRHRAQRAVPAARRVGLVAPCGFGIDPAVRSLALIGDSHAEHWRAAVEAVAEGEGRTACRSRARAVR